jgi:hypothetical protein
MAKPSRELMKMLTPDFARPFGDWPDIDPEHGG